MREDGTRINFPVRDDEKPFDTFRQDSERALAVHAKATRYEVAELSLS